MIILGLNSPAPLTDPLSGLMDNSSVKWASPWAIKKAFFHQNWMKNKKKFLLDLLMDPLLRH